MEFSLLCHSMSLTVNTMLGTMLLGHLHLPLPQLGPVCYLYFSLLVAAALLADTSGIRIEIKLESSLVSAFCLTVDSN